MIASRNMYTLQSHMCSVPNLISSVSTPVTSLAMHFLYCKQHKKWSGETENEAVMYHTLIVHVSTCTCTACIYLWSL